MDSLGSQDGQVYLDGVLTTIYSDTDVWAALGTSSDTANAAGTTAWARLKQAEADIDAKAKVLAEEMLKY